MHTARPFQGREDEPAAHPSPRRFARIAGIFYLLVFVFGIAGLTTSGDTRLTANLLTVAVYCVVTAMLYQLYKPASPTGSLVTALFSLTALTIGVLSDFGVVKFPINTLVLFGAYCIGLGWLTLKATFLPKAIGALAMAPGMIGEGVLTIWLLARGVDPGRWRAQSVQGEA